MVITDIGFWGNSGDQWLVFGGRSGSWRNNGHQ